MVYKGIIFDMDGVLFDTETFYYQRRKDFLASKGISIEHLAPSTFVGGRASQVWELILREDIVNWDIDQLSQEYAAYKEEHPAPYKELVFPDTKKSLQTLVDMGLELVIGSNTDKSDVQKAIEDAEIAPYFKKVFSGTDCIACKPHPAVYQKAQAYLGYPAEEVLVIEDSTKGIQAAVSAGLEIWAIEDKQMGLDQSQADRLFSSLSEVVEEIARKR
ncbi:HAD family phosphatase [Streptococcus gallolyticus]|uniref:HAD family hydrolase n=1 Tax=Streptococcus hepaticus TaxID=3349163 RepID=UPI001C97E4FD|nr:HAD family phosphatase [Streptococcus gallolyticus]MBY5040290.1 HAD family phosphatase [Streptococcus gallolyticus]